MRDEPRIPLFLPNIEGVDIVLIPDEEFAVGNDRMTPGRGPAGLNLKSSVLLVAGGTGFCQADNPLLTVEIESIVGEHDRPFANAPVAPRDLTGIEFHRGQDRVGKPIEIVANENR